VRRISISIHNLLLFFFVFELLSLCSVVGLNRYNISDRQLEGICVQRNLNTFFSSLSNNNDFFRVLFGFVDGTTQIFQGTVMFVENSKHEFPKGRLQTKLSDNRQSHSHSKTSGHRILIPAMLTPFANKRSQNFELGNGIMSCAE